MKPVLLAALLASCATAPAPRPPPRAADRVEIIRVQVGWYQLTTGQLNQPPVEDVTLGRRTPDEVGARHLAERVLDECKKGAPMAPLQQEYSEATLGTELVDGETKASYRDAALALHPGECTLFQGKSAWQVMKRVN